MKMPLLILAAVFLFSTSDLHPQMRGDSFEGIDLSGVFRVPDFGGPTLVLLASEPGNAGAALSGNSGEKPEKETPLWVKDLRRAEIVAFGSLPLTIFWTSTFVDLYRCAAHNWDTKYAPWPVKSAGAVEMTNTELAMMLTIAATASVTIAVTDHFIVRYKRSRNRKLEPVPERLIKKVPGSSPEG